MLGELNGIVKSTLRERIDKSIVGKLIKAKVNFGLGHPVIFFLNLLMSFAEELYKPVTRKFQTRRVNVNAIVEMCSADLIDMQAFSKDNNRIKYLQTVIYIFSKCDWIIA